MVRRWPPLYHLCSTTAKEACLRMALGPTRSEFHPLLAIIFASY